MTELVQLRYHQQTFDLLQETPVVSQTNLRLIGAWEKKHKVRLPGSLREWYSLEGAQSRGTLGMDGYSDASSIKPILKFHSDLQRRGQIDLSEQFYVSDVGIYNEDFSVIARYDGTDDPPVVERVEDSENYAFGKRLPFSAYVLRWVWDLMIDTAAERNMPVLHAGDAEFGPPELDFLLENMAECFRDRRFRGRRRMKSPFKFGAIIKLFPYRFAFRNRSGLVSIHCQVNPVREAGEASWTLLGNTDSDLFELAKLLWACGDFGRTLTAKNETSSAVLKRLRRHFRTNTTPKREAD